MFNKTNAWSLSFVLLMVSGCSNAVDKTLSPPSDAQWVNVEVKNPSPYTKPFPLEVRYISHECLKKRVSGFDGSTITEPSYNVVAIPMQQGAGEHWQGKVARNGGGACKWTLSAINLGIEYTDATHLGKDLVPGTAVGATIAFDDDASRNGQFTSVQGDLHISPKYYPYIREKKIDKIENTLSLLGKEDFLSLKAEAAAVIVFSPEIDESKITRFVGIKKKMKGVYPKIIYPDGSVAPDKTLFPDFNKVDGMSIK
ncbi:hypothetical protein SIL08_01015 [Scandinavium sp. V105_16]|uniref:Lipoprotein n=1 Tax=Scandinavium lactucae TaxID=3095028 RepID=A0AAJ2VRM3_9ENTR|nr:MULTISPECIES: hypothetical protein [unclassified Scandinavium]MDX6018877.1 hypothetical protein [Scandinavium sp. V105_16]MDX6030161.1 hypothetical protein [Scandinavium sp. V105_12]